MFISIYTTSAVGFLHADNTDLHKLIASEPRDTLQLAAIAALATSQLSQVL
jgi:hypothetical protein